MEPVEIAVVQVRDRVLRRDLQHALQLVLGELEAAGLDVEPRVLADDGAHAQTEILGVLDGGRRRRGGRVLGLDQLGGGLDPLGELRMAPEEKGLEAPALFGLAPQQLEDLRRLVRVVAGAHQLLHPAGVGVALEVAPVAVDRGDRGQLQPEAEQHVGGLAQDGGADVVAALRARSGRDRDANRGGHRQHRVEDLLVLRVAGEAEGMPVRDVGHLVTHDHRQLRLVVEPAQEPGVDVNAAVGQRERVERGVADHAEAEAGPAGVAHVVRQELVADLPEVLLEHRVVVGLGFLLELLLFLLGLRPEAELVGFRLEGLAVRADRRNAARGARARQEGGDDQPRDGAIGGVPRTSRHHARSLPSSSAPPASVAPARALP